MTDKNSVLVEKSDGIVYLYLSGDESHLPVLTAEHMDSLREALLELKSDAANVKGLVILGSALAGFCAGADVHAIKEVRDPKVGEELAKDGQAVFQLIADFPFPSLAAIHGPCVGGGFELSLACKQRIALQTDATRIGLPEIKLGILPGFGGTVRLPRLIGLPKALEIILNGKVISAVRAHNSGMIDHLVLPDADDKQAQFEQLKAVATEVLKGERTLQRRGLRFAEKFITNFSFGRMLASKKARAGILKETHGHYPAPLRALDVTIDGLSSSNDAALAREAKALGELIATDESKSLVHVYFCSEAASRLGKSQRDEVKGKPVGVLGAGVMGSGIAAVFLLKGHPVFLFDPSPEARARGEKFIQKAVEKRRGLSGEQREALLNSLHLLDSMAGLSSCELVVEAILEDTAIKQETFRKLTEIVSADCIIASNTSSLSISTLAENQKGEERFIGMHFFNPAEKMPLVELVRGAQTSDRALALSAAYASGIGKYPVVVEDVPGFLVNRILSPYIAEAGRLLSEGVSIEEVDACALAFGMPMGPFRMLDEVGLDVAAKVQEEMTKAYGDRMLAPEYPKRLLAASRLGKKSSAGFYSFRESEPVVDQAVYELLDIRPVTEGHLSRAVITQRLVYALVQEATLCFDEGVAGSIGPDSAGQVDLATVMGMGFAPFRGGVLWYAESVGFEKITKDLAQLEQRFGERFVAVDGLSKRAKGALPAYFGDDASNGASE